MRLAVTEVVLALTGVAKLAEAAHRHLSRLQHDALDAVTAAGGAESVTAAASGAVQAGEGAAAGTVPGAPGSAGAAAVADVGSTGSTTVTADGGAAAVTGGDGMLAVASAGAVAVPVRWVVFGLELQCQILLYVV